MRIMSAHYGLFLLMISGIIIIPLFVVVVVIVVVVVVVVAIVVVVVVVVQLIEWWNEVAYLGFRESLIVHSNPAVGFPLQPHDTRTDFIK